MSEARSNDADDMYGDLEIMVCPTTSSSGNNRDCDADSTTTPAWVEDEPITTLNDNHLKRVEEKLYTELLKAENEKRKEKQLTVGDYKKIQNEVLQLQKLIAEKDDKIADLSKKHANLQMNICSLYKTAKSESDQKDFLLKEANAKLDMILYKRNLPKDYFETQSLQTSIQKHNENSKEKSRGSSFEKGECSQTSSGVNNQSKKSSDNTEKNLKQSSAKRKRLRSPSNDTATHVSPNKRKSSDSNIIDEATQSVNNENVDVKQKFESNSTQSKTTLEESASSDRQNLGLDSVQNNVSDPIKKSGENPEVNVLHDTSLAETINLDASKDDVQLVEGDSEPSIAELFSQMQELAFKDPDTTNLIFTSLLPDALKQSFSDYESSQTESLNKLKQSFVKSYFQQCSEKTAESSKTPQKKSGGGTKKQTAFFFEQNFSHSETERSAVSDVVCEPQPTSSKINVSPTLSCVKETQQPTKSTTENSNMLITID